MKISRKLLKRELKKLPRHSEHAGCRKDKFGHPVALHFRDDLIIDSEGDLINKKIQKQKNKRH